MRLASIGPYLQLYLSGKKEKPAITKKTKHSAGSHEAFYQSHVWSVSIFDAMVQTSISDQLRKQGEGRLFLRPKGNADLGGFEPP